MYLSLCLVAVVAFCQLATNKPIVVQLLSALAAKSKVDGAKAHLQEALTRIEEGECDESCASSLLSQNKSKHCTWYPGFLSWGLRI